MAEGELVLVTGASGFIATHIVQQLQQEGYRVRGTVRSLQNEEKIKPLRNLCPDAKFPLELVEADLMKEEDWEDAVKGCTYVLHTASPFSFQEPEDENEVIKPAVDGTLAVLRAVEATGGVRRVVLTSSMAAVSQGFDIGGEHVFTEEDWTDLSQPGISAYFRSKTMAEKAAWEFMKKGQTFDLSVINPGLVLGPVLCGGFGASMETQKMLLDGKMYAVPNINFITVDVRDVASAHIRAMTNPEAAGKRHLAATSNTWMIEMAEILDKEFRPQGYYVPKRKLPSCFLWLGSFFDKTAKGFLSSLDKFTKFDNRRMKEVLGIQPRPIEDSLLDMCYSMIELGHIHKTTKYKPRNR